MRYRTLGVTGMEVSVYCLGAMMFGYEGNGDHEECTRIIHRALDEGINFIDTADAYSDGESEVIVGNALRGRRDDVIVSTKGYFPMGEGRNRGGTSRRWLVRAVDDSLRRLQTDWIDLYQVHRFDRQRRSKRRWACSPISSATARFARSAARRSRSKRSSTRTTQRSGSG